MNDLVIAMDNAVTLLRIKHLQEDLSPAEWCKLNLAITQSLAKIDALMGAPGFDTAAAFKEFFGRSVCDKLSVIPSVNG